MLRGCGAFAPAGPGCVERREFQDQLRVPETAIEETRRSSETWVRQSILPTVCPSVDNNLIHRPPVITIVNGINHSQSWVVFGIVIPFYTHIALYLGKSAQNPIQQPFSNGFPIVVPIFAMIPPRAPWTQANGSQPTVAAIESIESSNSKALWSRAAGTGSGEDGKTSGKAKENRRKMVVFP